jgi:Zn-dependent dipeptidase, microsomal dipeptidase homolog
MKYKLLLTTILLTTIISCDEPSSSIITIDTHIDINVDNFTDSLNYTMNTDTQFNIPNMIEGGLDVAWLVVYTAQGELNDQGYADAMDNAIAKFDAIDRLVDEYAPDQLEIALNSSDVRRILSNDKKVIMIGVENAYPMGLDPSNIKKFWERGARYVSLSHNGHSQLSDSNTGEFDDTALHNGLSPLREQTVELQIIME